MAGRSSTRHKREIQGRDSQGYEAPDFDEYNDYTAAGVAPQAADADTAVQEKPKADDKPCD